MYLLHILAVPALANVVSPHHFTEMEVEGQINNLKERSQKKSTLPQKMKRENGIYDKTGFIRRQHKNGGAPWEESEDEEDDGELLEPKRERENANRGEDAKGKKVAFEPKVKVEYF